MNNKVQRSIDVILFIDDQPVAGQEGARLNRSMSPINITNQINGEWSKSIGGVKDWSINANGVYVKNAKSLNKLEQAFLDNKEIVVKIILGKKYYSGNCLIINFPLEAKFNNEFKYSIQLLGTGELKLINENQ